MDVNRDPHLGKPRTVRLRCEQAQPDGWPFVRCHLLLFLKCECVPNILIGQN